MAKLGCYCGNVISNSASPNETTGCLLGDKSEETFFEYLGTIADDLVAHAQANKLDEWRQKYLDKEHPVASPGSMFYDLIYKRFSALSLEVWECDRCGRLWVQQDPRSQQLRGYAPDPGTPEVPHVLGPVEGDG